jgi:hypothetical protein
MNIFGFTITRTDKKKQDEEDLDVFKSTVIMLKDTINTTQKMLRHVYQHPDIETIQDFAQYQEEIESLVNIYNSNKFSKPASMFSLSNTIEDMRISFHDIAKRGKQLAMLKSETEMLAESFKYIGNAYSFNSRDISYLLKSSQENSFRQLMEALGAGLKTYRLSLNAILFTITYDSMRIESGVDIIKEYYETKNHTVPKKGIRYTLRFKQLSHDELCAQKAFKEENNNDPERNRI